MYLQCEREYLTLKIDEPNRAKLFNDFSPVTKNEHLLGEDFFNFCFVYNKKLNLYILCIELVSFSDFSTPDVFNSVINAGLSDQYLLS